MQCTTTADAPGALSIAYDADGSFYVACGYQNSVRHFAADGTPLNSWTGFAQQPPFFCEALGIAVDSQGWVYVGNYALGRIEKYDAHGHLFATFGSSFIGFPIDLAIDPRNDDVFVVNRGTTDGSILIFESGVLARSMPVNPHAYGLAIDGQGNLYVSVLYGAVEKRNGYGQVVGTWTVPDADNATRLASIALGPNGHVHVVDYGNGHVYSLTANLQLLGEWDLACVWPDVCAGVGGTTHHDLIEGVAVDRNGNAVLGTECGTLTLSAPSSTTPTRPVTWGTLKSLYR
jgi:streptogramin lyase